MSPKKQQSRRDFLSRSATTAAASAALAYFPWTKSALAFNSKNDRPQVGAIGVGSRGGGDIASQRFFADILAVCDVDLDRAEAAKAHEKIGKGKADVYQDYRRVLERNDLDVISISTVDHWHVKIAIEALEAGKHVFCQKPLTLTLEENQLIRRACEKHPKQIFQVGTQQRSSKDLFLRAVNMVQKGLLGDIKRVTIGIDGGREGGPFPIVDVPKKLDWNMWLGQAPKVDYRMERCHRHFRWWYEYSGGKFTDWGAHHIDIATWALRQDKKGMGPVEFDGRDAKHPVKFSDGMPMVDDSWNTAHDFSIPCRFANGVEMIISSRVDNGIKCRVDNGIKFEGTKGRIFVNRAKIVGKPIEEGWDDGKYTQADVERLHKGKRHEGHWKNFYTCIHEGGLPMSDVFTHVQAMNTCHLAAIAARLGKVIKWDPKEERIVGDDLAQSFVARKRREGFDILSV